MYVDERHDREVVVRRLLGGAERVEHADHLELHAVVRHRLTDRVGRRRTARCTVSGPSTTTAAAFVWSAAVRNRPEVTPRERTADQLGVVPVSVVVQLVEPIDERRRRGRRRRDRLRRRERRRATPGRRRPAAVSVDAEPKPPRVPVVLVELPGETTRMLVPSSLIWSCTLAFAPFADADGQDHGGDADEDAEHGQRRAQPVGADRLGRGAERVAPGHRAHPGECRRASSRRAARQAAVADLDRCARRARRRRARA